MRVFTTEDIRQLPGWCAVVKKPNPVQVRFATQAGTLATLEGLVPYVPGDALLQGPQQEMWPVAYDYFRKVYAPASGQPMGQPGAYCKQPTPVAALPMAEPFSARTGQGAVLHGKPGDWLVQYAAGHFGIVGGDIFTQTYDAVEG
ncbi:PGDYG domain-containing protein [Desulfovibrio cuneatus]|uniref:PGDYG domain-containing protein n=1 Tax=Desulfovibrio cuneatus TaxID=159728 RepID=UPI0003FD234F|nr:PGDYG domain-containing protein [Desulfovibrio cuneatus]